MKENEVTLENKIRESFSRLQKIEKGQRFLSKYYGVITATKVDNLGCGNFDIYGFDELEGLPRSNYYPRDLELIGHHIKLNDVLEYYKKKSNATSATAFKKEFYKIVMDWDLSSVYLFDQSEELKEFLNSL